MPILAAAAKLWPMSSKKTVSSALMPRRSNASWKNLGSGFLQTNNRGCQRFHLGFAVEL